MFFIVFVFLLGFGTLIALLIGLGLSAFSWVGGYDDVYEDAVESRAERDDRDLAFLTEDRDFQRFLRGDTHVEVDARQVHIHNHGNLIEGAKNG